MDQETIKCLKCAKQMRSVLTKKGVLIDVCPSCRGVWLDYGEVNFFIKDRTILKQYLHFGLDRSQRISAKCPKCDNASMQAGKFPGFSYQVEECSSCRGIYLDAQEFENIQKDKSFKKIQEDAFVSKKIAQNRMVFPVRMPSLALTSGMVLLSLYGLLFGVIVFAMEMTALPIWAGSIGLIIFVLLQFYFGPIFMDWQLRLFGSLDWVLFKNLPAHFQDSLMKLCRNNHIPIPRVGIIRDQSPQAYTYGRTPYSARVVFSEGMFQLLDQDELEAVLAHELGHIKHWDFALMTVIKIVPIILYDIFDYFREAVRESKGRKDIIAVMVVSYISYLVSEYLVLFVSRAREYYADRFSCFATKKPNALLTALVKVSYGLLDPSSMQEDSKQVNPSRQRLRRRQDIATQAATQQLKNLGHATNSLEKKNQRKKSQAAQSVEAFNIASAARSQQLSLLQQGGGEPEDMYNPEFIKDIMRWDLWNPWASYYELNSTHPLTAKRINAISSYALSLNQEPYLLFNKRKPESYWDDFFFDLFIVFLPYILGVLGVVSYSVFNQITLVQMWSMLNGSDWVSLIPLFGTFILCVSIGALIRVLKAYPGEGSFFPCSIAALLKVVKVSPVCSYPVILKGRILGRGVAGSIFSEDFFLKDKTGLIFLDHEPFGLNILFGIFHFQKFQRQEVTVKGWYRRSPIPSIEVKTIQSSHHTSRAYTYYYKIAFACIGLVISLLILLL